ncbi:MAG TPA: RepB family plasmid replication initiator protein [Candidatus Moranbacteria bacterium]|nr:RepB family plasmid replication initiator protein [Candidatus Moranbacteria bacterium]
MNHLQINNFISSKFKTFIQISDSLSLSQKKCYNFLLSITKIQIEKLKSQGEKFNYNKFKIKAKYLLEFFDFGEKNYHYLRNMMEQLTKTTVKYKISEHKWGAFNLLAGFEYKYGYIYFSFPHQILDNIIKINCYSLKNLQDIKNFKSKYSLVLYELLGNFKDVNEFTLSINYLKKIMKIKENQYKIITMFRKRVLDPAVKEINSLGKMQFKLDFHLIKSGKKYLYVKFIKIF